MSIQYNSPSTNEGMYLKTNHNVLNICLVSHRSLKYVKRFMSSLLPQLVQSKSVKLYILLNGSDEQTIDYIQEMKNTHFGYIEVFIQETNDSRYAVNMAKMVHNLNGWVIFPGDDDEFLEGSVQLIINNIDNYPNKSVIAFSGEAYNETGKHLYTEEPIDSHHKSNLEYLVSAMYKPPFLWPAAVFNLDFFYPEKLSSRYANDWLISLSSICKCESVTISESVIKYNVHSDQESEKALLDYKLHDAKIAFLNWLDLNFLKDKLSSLSLSEIEFFWDKLLENDLFYGNSKYSKPIIEKIAHLIISQISEVKLISKIVIQVAANDGVIILPSNVINYVLPDKIGNLKDYSRLILWPNKDLCKNSHLEFNSEVLIRVLRCRHDTPSPFFLQYDCSQIPINLSSNPDIFIQKVLHNSLVNIPQVSISDGEQLVLRIFRYFRKILPIGILKLLRRAKVHI